MAELLYWITLGRTGVPNKVDTLCLCLCYLVTARVQTVTMKQQPTITQPHPPSGGDTLVCFFLTSAIVEVADWTGFFKLVFGPGPGLEVVWSQLISLIHWMTDLSSPAASGPNLWK